MRRIEDVIVAGQRHGRGRNAKNSLPRSDHPVGALAGGDDLRDEVRPSVRNIKSADFEIVGNPDFDRDVVFWNASVVNDYLKCCQDDVFRRIYDSCTRSIPPAAVNFAPSLLIRGCRRP